MNDTPGTQGDQLRQYLRTLLIRTALLHVGAGLVSFVAMGAWVLLALALWTAVAHEPSLATATFIARSAIVLLLGLFAYFVAWPLIRMPRLDHLAAEVERRKDLKELVRAGFEFSQDETATRRYSPALVREVIQQAVRKIAGLQVRYLFLSRKDLALMPVAYGGLLVLLLIALFNPALLSNATQRIVAPRAVAAVSHRANIHASPGNITVLAGSDVTVKGLDLGRTVSDVSISFNLAEDFWKTEPTTGVAGEGAFDRYEYTFKDLRHTVSYYFQADDYKSDTYTITVVHEPLLTDLRIELTPPSYTGAAPTILEDNGGNVQALEGTAVKITGRSNNPLAAAWVKFGKEDERAIDHEGDTVSFTFTALKDGHYSVLLEDSLGFRTRDPLAYSIEVFQDNPPTVDLLEPGADTVLPRNQQIDIGFVGSDDYGVNTAAIYFRKSGESEFRRIGIALNEQRSKKEIATAYRWDLSDITLFPGNAIEYFVQVADNNVVTGPGVARSEVYRITMPTMAELYDRARKEEAVRNDTMESAIKDSEELSERLEKIAREYLKTEKMEWAQKKDLDKAIEKQKSIEEKLSDIKQSLDKTLDELSENEMTSQEIGEKLEEIRELLDDIESDELRKYMEELRSAVEKLDPEDIKKALENLEINTDKMLEQLERTANLLRQIQKEQQMESLVRKSQDLMDKQKELAEETADTEASDKEQMDELAERQDDLAQQADEMQKEMGDLSEQMQADDPQVSEQMQQMSEQMKQDGPQENMRNASQKMQGQQKQQAMQQQQEAMDKMISLFQNLNQAQMQMQANQGQRMAANFQKFAQQTLELSFRQEELSKKLREHGALDEEGDTQGLAHEQMSYLRATEKVTNGITKMAGNSLLISDPLMRALGDALERMQNSVLFLEQNKSFMSTAHATNAVESLNEATIEMLTSAKQCSQGQPSASSGQQSAQMLMQQMIPQQQEVLRQTQEMLRMEMAGEALRQQRQAQLDRLAAQQRTLQELAEKIEKDMKGNKDILGKLDRTAKEMEAVAKSLERGDVNDELVTKEQRILSRLLDAQRSTHTRDFEKQRESMTADEVFSKSLGARAKAPVSQSLREEIRRAMQLKAPGEFEDLIKLYFRALAEESSLSSDVEGN